jgi:rubrerythrin
VIEELTAAYHAEREQATFYRALSSVAEEVANEADIEALNGLLADEQHHLSRLKNRLVELGVELPQGPDLREGREALAAIYPDWRAPARLRERAEVERYQAMLALDLDPETEALVRSILVTERQHEANLGGKYMDA